MKVFAIAISLVTVDRDFEYFRVFANCKIVATWEFNEIIGVVDQYNVYVNSYTVLSTVEACLVGSG